MAAHICEGCGLLHDAPAEAGEPVEVQLARIAKEQAVEVAKISARQDHDWNETRVEVAAIEAEAEVGAATAEAEVLGELLNADSSEQEPFIIDAPPAPDPMPESDPTDDAAPPPVEDHEPDDDKPRKRSLGMW